MPITMMGNRMVYVTDDVAEEIITERLAQFDAIAASTIVDGIPSVQDQRRAKWILDEAELLERQLEPKGAKSAAWVFPTAPRFQENPRGDVFETKSLAEAVLRDAERGFGLAGLTIAWDLTGNEMGRVEQARPRTIHLNPHLLEGDERQLAQVVGHEAHHAMCYVQKKAWTAEEDQTADEAGRWFARWRNR